LLLNDQGQPFHHALGYARREALEKHQPLIYPGGTASPVSIPAATEIKLPR
jgi:hypothetical protein